MLLGEFLKLQRSLNLRSARPPDYGAACEVEHIGSRPGVAAADGDGHGAPHPPGSRRHGAGQDDPRAGGVCAMAYRI